MKKLLAIVLTLVMALGCLGAWAEETVEVPAYSQETLIAGSVSHDLVQMFVPMFGEVDPAVVEAVLNALEAVCLDVRESENVASIDLTTADYSLASTVCAVDEEGVTIVSDLFPHFAVRTTLAELDEAAESLTAMADEMGLKEDALPFSIEMPEITEEQAAALTESITAYVEDIEAFITAVQEGAVVAEDGSTVTIPLTMNQVAGLGEALLTRLNGDEALKSFLNFFIDQVNAQVSEEERVSLDQLLQMGLSGVQSLKTEEDQFLGAATMGATADGGQLVSVNIGNMLDIAITLNPDATIDLTALFAANGITDKDAQIAGILDGSNADDVLVKAALASTVDEDGTTVSSAVIDFLVGGVDIKITDTSKSYGEGTADYSTLNTVVVSCDMLGGDLFELNVAGIYCDDVAAPDLEGLTVISLAKATEEEQEALAKDVVNYGIPALISRFVLAAPDEAAALVDACAASKAGTDGIDEDFESDGIDEDFEFDGEDYVEEDDGIDLTGVWTAGDSTLTLDAEGNFTLNWKGETVEGTWEKMFGFLYLDTETVGTSAEYTESSITMTLGFSTLEFAR